MSTLSNKLVKAITENNANELERLIIICDLLHKGLPMFDDTYTPNDLPTDMIYEEAVSKLKQLRGLDIAMTIPDMETITDKIQKRKQSNVLLFMDGIQSPTMIPSIDDVILMPKFDGCSVGVELVRQTPHQQFVVSYAHTRGNDDLTGNRKCQTKTELIQQVFNLDMFNKCLSSGEFTLSYKDERLVGNNNPVLTKTIHLDDIDKIVLRGEFVNNDKNKLPPGITTNIGLAAGTINSDVPQYINYLTFQPFEISCITTRVVNRDDNVVFENYIPTQLSTVSFMKKFGLITYPLLNMKHIDENTNMERVFEYFQSKCSQPLDGVVYCQTMWTYPKTIDETSKHVNYGKYKWKPHNAQHTMINGIEYTVGKTGKIVPTLLYNPIKINEKNYSRVKTTFTKMREFGAVVAPIDNMRQSMFGIGLVCEIELKQDIAPYIAQVFPDMSTIDKPIYIPSHCPWCGSVLQWSKTGKDLLCVNDSCQAVNIERCVDFLKQIGFKGISTKTCQALDLYNGLITASDASRVNWFDKLYTTKLHSEFHESGVAMKRSIKYKGTTSNTRIKRVNDFDSLLNNLTVGDFIVSCSLMTKKRCDDWLIVNHISRGANLLEFIKQDNGLLESIETNNCFTRDLLEWLKTL